MSNKVFHRLTVIRRLSKNVCAATTERQVQRLIKRYCESLASVLTNMRRGKLGNHRIDDVLRCQILTLLRDNYIDFGSTLAAEKIQERHGITSLLRHQRCWMTADGVEIPHVRRQPRIYDPRQRRDYLGELILFDGSHHDWFEERVP